MAKTPADFKGLCFLPAHFDLVRVKHCEVKDITLISPDVTLACFTKMMVGTWHEAAQPITDITN